MINKRHIIFQILFGIIIGIMFSYIFVNSLEPEILVYDFYNRGLVYFIVTTIFALEFGFVAYLNEIRLEKIFLEENSK